MSNLKLESFLGINFGTTLETVKEIFSKKPGSVFDEINSDHETLFFKNVQFAGRETEFIMFLFFENKLSKSAVYIKPKLEIQTVEIYKEIRNELNQKYFTTDQDFEIYHQPYEKDDGYTETAISLGKADFSSFWSFKTSTSEDNYISLKINENLNIVLAYEDGYLTNLLVNKNKENYNKDY